MQRVAISMFDESGNMLRPWAEAGFACYAYDWEGWPRRQEFESGGFIEWIRADLMPDDWRVPGSRSEVLNSIIAKKPYIVFGFPPCDDMAVSGSRHFEAKRAEDPDFQRKAVALARTVETVGEACGCIWVFENPVSVLASIYRKSDYRFHPHNFGGYLPENDVHPRWPKYIAPRDAYEKRTCLWVSSNFSFPRHRNVEPIRVEYDNGVSGSQQFAKLGGKSKKTKQIRSETGRGFAIATFEANWSSWGRTTN